MKDRLKAISNSALDDLFEAILADDRTAVRAALKQNPTLLTQTANADKFHDSITHYTYRGDTALHLAAAAYRVQIIRGPLGWGNPSAAANRRRSTSLHYASDGSLDCPNWAEKRQVETIRELICLGANVDAQDANGATPLHRAVRTRCAGAVHCLLDYAADATLKNNSGSTPFHLAVQNTGRGGSGSVKAKVAQQRIIHSFLEFGITPDLKDGAGKTVFERAKEASIKLLPGN